MNIKLTSYGGVDEIGGNKILLRDNDTSVFLDFGISYSRSNEFFEFPLLQQGNIDNLLKTKLIPELEGLYRYYSFTAEYDASGPISIKGTPEEKKFDVILLSHTHMDHFGYIGLLREDIPICLSKISDKIIGLYSKTGRDDFHVKIGHLQFKKSKKIKKNKRIIFYIDFNNYLI